MSISVKSIRVSIGGVQSSGFDIELEGVLFRLDDFSLIQNLLSPNVLSFSMHKLPEEDIREAQFQVCGQIVGKEVKVELDTANVEQESLKVDRDSTAEVTFKGVIVSASGSRNRTTYSVQVQAMGWDGLLDDNPACKSFEKMTLAEIVKDVLKEYQGYLEATVNPRFTDPIPYCVQYNETNWQFLQRLARRYGEWLYNDGERLIFGQLPEGESVRLSYPSHDIPDYQVDLAVKPVSFSHVASSYNAYDSLLKPGLAEMQRPYNDLADQVFSASRRLFRKATVQNLHSGGFADNDGRETVLKVSTKTQARGQKAGMATYTGSTYCSKLKMAGTLVIVDNYLTQSSFSNEKSQVEQDGILIVGMVHHFSADETYGNHFTGIPVACDYPPYADPDVYPFSPSCRARVVDNEDPQNLGRVRVQFDWQSKSGGGMMTPWLRMAQPYAGGGKGFSFIPEIGEEVMVDFEGGNAERPYVKGTLYNGVGNPDSAWVPQGNRSNKIKAIRTRNGHTIEIHDEGNDGYIRIYDSGKENYILTFSTDKKLIRLESTGNIELYAKKDIIMHAGHDITATADNDMVLEAHNDQQRTADNDIREHAGNDRTTNVDRNDSLTVGANQFVNVQDNKDEQVAHKLQTTAENIRVEAKEKLLQYSKTHQQKADQSMALNAGTQIEIKAGVVKVN